jgi:hypothetical protein
LKTDDKIEFENNDKLWVLSIELADLIENELYFKMEEEISK